MCPESGSVVPFSNQGHTTIRHSREQLATSRSALLAESAETPIGLPCSWQDYGRQVALIGDSYIWPERRSSRCLDVAIKAEAVCWTFGPSSMPTVIVLGAGASAPDEAPNETSGQRA